MNPVCQVVKSIQQFKISHWNQKYIDYKARPNCLFCRGWRVLSSYLVHFWVLRMRFLIVHMSRQCPSGTELTPVSPRQIKLSSCDIHVANLPSSALWQKDQRSPHQQLRPRGRASPKCLRRGRRDPNLDTTHQTNACITTWHIRIHRYLDRSLAGEFHFYNNRK